MLILIIGSSGVGKNTVADALLKRNPEFTFAVSTTTRTKRDGEIEGIDYFFVSIDKYKKMVDENKFAENIQYHGNLYGLEKAQIKNDGVMLFIVEEDGIEQIKTQKIRHKSIFMFPPSFKELERRLGGRKTGEAENTERLKTARHECVYAEQCDALVINDNLDKCVTDIELLIKKWIVNY